MPQMSQHHWRLLSVPNETQGRSLLLTVSVFCISIIILSSVCLPSSHLLLCLGRCVTGAQSGSNAAFLWSGWKSWDRPQWKTQLVFSDLHFPILPCPFWSSCPPLEHKHTAVGSLKGHMNKICKAIGAGARKILLTAPRGAPTSLNWVCLLGANDCVQADLNGTASAESIRVMH